MDYELTEQQKQIIADKCRAFWADLKVGILFDFDASTGLWMGSGHVFLYVDTWQGAGYFSDLGWSETPQAMRQAVLDCDVYKNRSTVSAKNGVLDEIAKLPTFKGE